MEQEAYNLANAHDGILGTPGRRGSLHARDMRTAKQEHEALAREIIDALGLVPLEPYIIKAKLIWSKKAKARMRALRAKHRGLN